MNCNYVISALLRKKTVPKEDVEGESQLKRCLSLFDLVCLGIGSTLGMGVYVLAGVVASKSSGPAICISFLIAAVASVFAAFCYAEFGARVPRAGSAYVYSYVTVGELMAFVIGWNLILEYIIGTASVARGYSLYIDSLFNGTIAKHFEEWVPMNVKGLGSYPDPIAFFLTIFLTILLVLGVKESIRLMTVMTLLNIGVVAFVIITGFTNVGLSTRDGHSFFHNWQINKNDIPSDVNGGSGGFLPFGVSGMLSGAATCFYAFVGFDAIATTGEEAKNPKRSIPLSIIISLFIIFLTYFGISSVQTLMLPYYYQSDKYTNGAPLPYIFEHVGWQWAKWIVSIGALSGLSTSLLGGMYPLPRVIYAMANDGVIFRFLAKVHHRFQTPMWATLLGGVLTAAMAALFNIDELADMMSIGTLLAYTLVAESILIIRYSNSNPDSDDFPITRQQFFEQLTAFRSSDGTTRLSSYVSNVLVAIISLLIVVLDIILIVLEPQLYKAEVLPLALSGVFLVIIVIVTILLVYQPQVERIPSFQVPWVPVVPLLSVFVNVYLMLKLSYQTWIRFAVWMVLGFVIYFSYGIRNSSAKNSVEKRQH